MRLQRPLIGTLLLMTAMGSVPVRHGDVVAGSGSAKVHSVADVNGPNLTVRQIAIDGAELDRFVVTK
jgi:hypothetical protein